MKKSEVWALATKLAGDYKNVQRIILEPTHIVAVIVDRDEDGHLVPDGDTVKKHEETFGYEPEEGDER